MEKPVRPEHPGPQATAAEWRRYAEGNAACSTWDAEHPDDPVAEHKPDVTTVEEPRGFPPDFDSPPTGGQSGGQVMEVRPANPGEEHHE